MNHHHIKIYPEHYNNVKSGTKTFEIRVNDRGYQKGDAITLYYWIKDTNSSSIDWYVNESRPALEFKIGDVYPIDGERVVFSILSKGQKDEG